MSDGEMALSLQRWWLVLGAAAAVGFHVQVLWAAVSLGGGAMEGGAGRRRLRRALVGAQEHLVLGGALGAAGLLLHQELLEAVGGEGERLTLELHQVGVLQPGLGEAVAAGRAGPENSNDRVSAAAAGPAGMLLTRRSCSASSCRRPRRSETRLGKVCSGRTLPAGSWTGAVEDLCLQRAAGR